MLKIDHIDAIARAKGRDVLMVVFGPADFIGQMSYKLREDSRRDDLIKWLTEHEIQYTPCAEYASENGFTAYRGQLFIDLTYDKQEHKCRLLLEHLETPDGQPKDKEVVLYFLPLEDAMKNAHHDEPGFWERWAETF